MGWSSSLSKAQTQCTTSILTIPCLFCPAGMYFEARRIHFRMLDHHTAFQDPAFSRRYWMLPLHTGHISHFASFSLTQGFCEAQKTVPRPGIILPQQGSSDSLNFQAFWSLLTTRHNKPWQHNSCREDCVSLLRGRSTYRLLPSVQWYLDVCGSREQAHQPNPFTGMRRASSHISKFLLPAKYPRQGLYTPKHQVLASFQVKSVSAMSLLTELPQRHSLLQARPSLCCAAGYLGTDIYPEPAVFLPGFQALYHHFTIWHAQSAYWPRYRCCTEGFFPHHSTEMQIPMTKRNFLKHFSAAPGKFVNRNGHAAPRNWGVKQIQTAAMPPNSSCSSSSGSDTSGQYHAQGWKFFLRSSLCRSTQPRGKSSGFLSCDFAQSASLQNGNRRAITPPKFWQEGKLFLRHLLWVCVIQNMAQSYFALSLSASTSQDFLSCMSGALICAWRAAEKRNTGNGGEGGVCNVAALLASCKAHQRTFHEECRWFFSFALVGKWGSSPSGWLLAAQKLDYLLDWSKLMHSKQDFHPEISVCGKQRV